ncbi:MAG: FliH/SctL family protein [Actinomycetota bacterium]|nr:FliH/SctL family protein [Actinomycetota bacterium]
MSSSAEARGGRRVLRAAHNVELAVARVVAPRGTVVTVATRSEALVTAPTLEERLAEEHRLGYEDGLAAARADAAAAAELERTAALHDMRSVLAAACSRVARERRSVVDEVVGEAVDLAFELLSTLVTDETAHSDSPVRAAVVRALSLAPEGDDVRVRVHPDSPVAPEELRSLTTTGRISVVCDPTIERTGCVVEVGACRIDAQIGPALERVRAALASMRSGEGGDAR